MLPAYRTNQLIQKNLVEDRGAAYPLDKKRAPVTRIQLSYTSGPAHLGLSIEYWGGAACSQAGAMLRGGNPRHRTLRPSRTGLRGVCFGKIEQWGRWRAKGPSDPLCGRPTLAGSLALPGLRSTQHSGRVHLLFSLWIHRLDTRYGGIGCRRPCSPERTRSTSCTRLPSSRAIRQSTLT